MATETEMETYIAPYGITRVRRGTTLEQSKKTYKGPTPLWGAKGLPILSGPVKKKLSGMPTPEQVKAAMEGGLSINQKLTTPGLGITGVSSKRGDTLESKAMGGSGVPLPKTLTPVLTPKILAPSPATKTLVPAPKELTGMAGDAQRTQATTDFAVNMPAPIVGPTAPLRGVGARLLDTAKKTGTGIATWAENPAIAKGVMTAGLTMLATPPRNVPYSHSEMIGRGGIAGLGAFEAEKEAERSRVELARKAGVEQEQLALKGREVATAEAQQKAGEAKKQISIGRELVYIPGGGGGYATISAKTGEQGYIPVPDWLITQLQNKGKEGGSEADITKILISGVSGVMPELVKRYGGEDAQRIAHKLGESLWNVALKTKYEGQKEETPGYFGKLFGKEEIPEIPNYIVPMEVGGIPKAPVAPPQGAKPILDAQGKQEIIDGFPAFQLLSGKYWTAKP